MSYGQLAVASATISGAATNNFTPSDFTDVDGSAVSSGDAILVRSVVHEDDVTISRTGDPDQDSTFEINLQIGSRSGAGERHSDTLVTTQYAGIEVVNDGASSQEVFLVGEHAPASDVFVEQADGLADASELVRTTASRGTEESVLEVAMGGDAELIRRYDPNDDGTYEFDAIVETYTGTNVVTETWLSSVDAGGRTNPAMQTAVNNVSGGTADYVIIGTVTES